MRARREPPHHQRGGNGGRATEEQLRQSAEARQLRKIGEMVDARFAAIADRLAPERSFRPPLGPATASVEETATRPVPAARTSKKKSAGDTPAKSGAGATARGAPSAGGNSDPLPPTSQGDSLCPARPTESDSWTTVVKRRKGKKPTKTGPPAGPDGRPAKPSSVALAPVGNKKTHSEGVIPAATSAGGATRRPVKLWSSTRRRRARQPRSAAIMITLAPWATEKGVTYTEVLYEAKGKVDIEKYGIKELKYRIAQTGARILEVRGNDMASKADSLAAEIRTALADKDLTVSRPERTADIRLLGLDESVSNEDVEAAIRRATQCEGQIKTGPIHMMPMGLGSVWLRCPVAAANKLATAGRLLVGWRTSARVQLLAPRPPSNVIDVWRGATPHSGVRPSTTAADCVTAAASQATQLRNVRQNPIARSVETRAGGRPTDAAASLAKLRRAKEGA